MRKAKEREQINIRPIPNSMEYEDRSINPRVGGNINIYCLIPFPEECSGILAEFPFNLVMSHHFNQTIQNNRIFFALFRIYYFNIFC